MTPPEKRKDERSQGQPLAHHGHQGSEPNELHRNLQQKLGDGYEVIFEIEGLQIRRMGDRAFIAEYIPDKQIVRAGPHVLFHDKEDEDPEKLRQEGQRRLDKQIAEWKEFGFEPLEEAHLMTLNTVKNSLYEKNVPRYIQPMGKRVDSLEAAAEAVRWVRDHRKLD